MNQPHTIEKTVVGDLLNAKEKYICQQCNCVTMIPHGLSVAIAKRYPWADVYGQRKPHSRNCTSEPATPGTIQVSGSFGKHVVHMFAQFYPGKPGTWNGPYAHLAWPGRDDANARAGYFKQCLERLDAMNLDCPVAMPMYIGCGLAGGNWAAYSKMLEDCRTTVIFYKL